MLYTGKHVRVFGTRDLKEPFFFFHDAISLFKKKRKKRRRREGLGGGEGGNFSKAPPLPPYQPSPTLLHGGNRAVRERSADRGRWDEERSKLSGGTCWRARLFLQHCARLLLWGNWINMHACARTMLHDRYLIHDAFLGGLSC